MLINIRDLESNLSRSSQLFRNVSVAMQFFTGAALLALQKLIGDKLRRGYTKQPST